MRFTMIVLGLRLMISGRYEFAVCHVKEDLFDILRVIFWKGGKNMQDMPRYEGNGWSKGCIMDFAKLGLMVVVAAERDGMVGHSH